MKNPMNKFSIDLRPICLPPMKMWQMNFVDALVRVFGFGRTESTPVPGKDQTSCGLLRGDIQVVGHNSVVCNKVGERKNLIA